MIFAPITVGRTFPEHQGTRYAFLPPEHTQHFSVTVSGYDPLSATSPSKNHHQFFSSPPQPPVNCLHFHTGLDLFSKCHLRLPAPLKNRGRLQPRSLLKHFLSPSPSAPEIVFYGGRFSLHHPGHPRLLEMAQLALRVSKVQVQIAGVLKPQMASGLAWPAPSPPHLLCSCEKQRSFSQFDTTVQ